MFQRGFHLASKKGSSGPFEKENVFSPSSVSQGPPPSFLISTPLGGPLEGTVSLNPIAELPQTRQPYEARSVVEMPPHSLKGANQVQRQPMRRAGKLKKHTKPVKGVELNGILHRWINQEVRLSMSKMSVMSLVLGLLFLGTLFFIIGFLAAVSTLKREESARSPESAWQASNAPAKGGPPGGKLGQMAAHMGGSIAGRAIRKEVAPLRSAMGATTAIVPKPLQPFARYGMGSGHVKARQTAGHLNPFHRGRPGAVQHPSQQLQGVPQQYQQHQMQVYAPPAGSPQMPYGYQAPSSYPQGGGQVYGQPQIQQMQPQQPYQQPVPQQMMVPQQQMMQQPQQYQQQMVPQQGYYR